MKLTIEKIKPAKKPGTYWVTAGGQDYWTKAPGIEQASGRVIEAKLGQFDGDKGPVKTIQEFSMTQETLGAAHGVVPWWWPSVSNVWAHAIQSGHISPGVDMPVSKQLEQWALAVKYVALKLTKPEEDDEPE